MEKQYTKEQFWELYKKLPDDLKDALFSEDNTNAVENICKKNEIEEESVPEIASLIGHVFLGILPFEEFEKSLKKDIGLKNDKAKKVATEIFRFIFFPVKNSIETLYIKPTTEKKPPTEEEATLEVSGKEESANKRIEEQKPAKKPLADTYREEIN